MAKVSQSQIKRVQVRLEEMSKTKLEVIKNNLPDPEDSREDTKTIGYKWARENPTKFVALCEKESKGENYYAHFELNVLNETPPVKKNFALVKSIEAANAKRMSDAELALLTKVTSIVDDLHFKDSEDAVKAMADFEKFNP